MKNRFDEIDYFQEVLHGQRTKGAYYCPDDGYDDLIAELLLHILVRLRSISTFICFFTGVLISLLISILLKLV